MSNPNLVYGLIIYIVGLAVLVFLTRTLKLAGQQMGADGPRTANQLIAGLWTWAVIANAYAHVTGPGFAWLAPAVALPLIVGTALTFRSNIAALLEHVSIARLVGVQVYRNAGAVFLLAHFGFGHYMSREFALNAGWGDVLTGMLAVPVALMAFYRVRFWPLFVVIWCAIGAGDLILAPVTAQTYGAMLINDFPLNTIPLFFGPPLGILLHIVALRCLWLQRQGRVGATAIAAGA